MMNSRIGVSYMDPACRVNPRLAMTDLKLLGKREYSGDEARAVAEGYASLLDSVVNRDQGQHDADPRPGTVVVFPRLELSGLERAGTGPVAATAEYCPQTRSGKMQLEWGPLSLQMDYESTQEAERFREHPQSAAMVPWGREEHLNRPTHVSDRRQRDDGKVERREVVFNSNGTFTVMEELLEPGKNYARLDP